MSHFAGKSSCMVISVHVTNLHCWTLPCLLAMQVQGVSIVPGQSFSHQSMLAKMEELPIEHKVQMASQAATIGAGEVFTVKFKKKGLPILASDPSSAARLQFRHEGKYCYYRLDEEDWCINNQHGDSENHEEWQPNAWISSDEGPLPLEEADWQSRGMHALSKVTLAEKATASPQWTGREVTVKLLVRLI